MDTATIERQDLAAVQPLLGRIARLQREELPGLLGDLARSGFAAPWRCSWVRTPRTPRATC